LLLFTRGIVFKVVFQLFSRDAQNFGQKILLFLGSPMKSFLCAFIAAAILSGCASQSGVVPNGQGGYVIAKQAATGFPGIGNLKTDAMAEASQYCAAQGREFVLTNAKETQPPYVMGNYPRAEIEF
jgi:hypothetical protein